MHVCDFTCSAAQSTCVLPLQGGAADLVKLAMINLQRVLDRKLQHEPPLLANGPPPCRLVLQVTGCCLSLCNHINMPTLPAFWGPSGTSATLAPIVNVQCSADP